MPVEASELEVVYSRLEKRSWRARNIAVGLCNTRHQGDFDSGASTVKIPVNDTTVALSDYVDGSDWTSTVDDVDISYIDWNRLTSPSKRVSRFLGRQPTSFH